MVIGHVSAHACWWTCVSAHRHWWPCVCTCALMHVCLRIGTDGLVSAHAHLWTCVYACTLMNMCLRMRTDWCASCLSAETGSTSYFSPLCEKNKKKLKVKEKKQKGEGTNILQQAAGRNKIWIRCIVDNFVLKNWKLHFIHNSHILNVREA